VVLDKNAQRSIRLALEAGYDEVVVTKTSAVGTILLVSSQTISEREVRTGCALCGARCSSGAARPGSGERAGPRGTALALG
jgi:hypothetical protein